MAELSNEEALKKIDELNADNKALKEKNTGIISEFDTYKTEQKEVRDSIHKRIKKEVSGNWESWAKETFAITDDLQGDDLKALVADKAKSNGGKLDGKSFDEIEAEIGKKFQGTILQLEGKLTEKNSELNNIVIAQKEEKKTSYLTSLAQLQLKKDFKLNEDANINQTRLSAVIQSVKGLKFSDGENPHLIDSEGTAIYENGEKVLLSKKIGSQISLFFEKSEEVNEDPLKYIDTKTGKKVVITDNIQQLERELRLTTDSAKYNEILKKIEILRSQQK